MAEPLLETVAPCEIHSEHTPNSRINQRHHIWPLNEGGPDTADNIVAVCPTGHSNIHALIKEFKLYRGDVPYVVLRVYSFQERKYAKLGYERIIRQAM